MIDAGAPMPMTNPSWPSTMEEPLDEPRLTLTKAQATLAHHFAGDVAAGLGRARKRLPCRYLYDHRGSRLFEAICALPEYYPTRVEQALLDHHAAALLDALPPEAQLVELGSGNSQKTRTLIEALLGRQRRLRYQPIDISVEVLESSARDLLHHYPALDVNAIAAEYAVGLDLLAREETSTPRLFLWLGSNVGNFSPAEARRFLRRVRAAMSPADLLLIGVDMPKPRRLLEAAYDDTAGITARFNLNLLVRINRELGGHFSLYDFSHRARWNDERQRVEMHLVSGSSQSVPIDALEIDVPFSPFETIFTESSYKYSLPALDALAAAAGFAVALRFVDEAHQYGLHLLAQRSD